MRFAMDKQHYFFKLIAPRPTFPQDMTDAEKLVMKDHSRHMRESFDSGKLLVYGPVMATGETFGMAVLEVADETEARRFAEGDPSVRAGLNRFELYPMEVAAARALK